MQRGLLTEEASLELLETGEAPRPNEEFFRSSGGFLSEHEAMKLRGIDPEKPETQALLAAISPVESFNHRYINGEVDASAADLMVLAMMQLEQQILRSPHVPDEISVRARGSLIACAGTVLRVQSLEHDSPLFEMSRRIALAGAYDPDPKYDPQYHLPFDHPGWGGPSPRIDAAQAVSTLVWNHTRDEESLGAFERLSRDQVPAVRFQIARGLPGLFNHEAFKEEFWQLVASMIETETTGGVLVGLLSSLRAVALSAPEKVVDALMRLLDRRIIEKKRSDATRLTLDMLVGLYVAKGFLPAREQIRRFENEVAKYDVELSQAALVAFQYLSPVDAVDPVVRSRSRELLGSILRSARGFAAQIRRESPDKRDLAAPAKILETLASRMFFAFDLVGSRAPNQKALTDDDRVALYSEAKPLIKAICQVEDEGEALIPLAASGAHYLLQLLNKTSWIDAEDALLCASAVCRHGSLTGYLLDSMARTEAVSLVEHAFADHREALRKPNISHAVGVLLDLFIRSGWSEAIALSFRLDEAFR
jgi:hypothetical protein